METPICSICGKSLAYLGGPGLMFKSTASIIGATSELDQWRGTVCQKCSYVFCPDCLEVSPPPTCPICKESTKPAMRGYLQNIYPRKLVIEAKPEKIEAKPEKKSWQFWKR